MPPKLGPKLGYVLPTREFIMNGRPEAAPLLDLAARAEALGYDSVWVGDSLVARPRHEPLTLLAAIAIRAPTVTLGTAVLLPVLRNPVVLAHQLATLDQISEGRLIVGFGVGPDTPGVRAEFAAAGVPFEKRTGATLEGLRLCQALWTGEPVEWDGRWQVSGAVLAPVPHRPGGPPIWIGGSATRVRERAGRIFDGWVPVSPNAAQWGEHWTEIKGIAAAEAIAGVSVLHAGTRQVDGRMLANGGRVLGVTAQGTDIKSAQARAYQGVDAIDWPEGFCRRDIGWRAIQREDAQDEV